ncbi:Thermoresistant gluconokinase [Variovorax sp. PBL-H6]|uniref:gluconokinase n=1 Tax=Variovorax sp. PBL-H6 TaxID=434009 RepID=UPI001316E8AB|nr:gluconokinase [Variovorax sp. PBL-H6]VTU34464.1 Thermoresistant gluconokinase [Variovorax sp. PBL-H6]
MAELYLSSSESPPCWLVVMGVSGCGKSTLGAALAQALGLPLIEGDDFHSPGNVSKMHAGIALTDADRAGWLETLAGALAAHPRGAVLTCSALKRAYRDRLRAGVPRLLFVFMELSREEAERRVAGRGTGHFFSPSLVADQFATLESPVGEADVLAVDATAPLPGLVERVSGWVRQAS